ncbi:hypothetical protein OEA41_006082 [Lepraria neglecta]|uniref:TMEM205-like domain-containing protein n=1 Tax=Lepraria neglecta TaxID=209136 RepID=A0AAD9Z8C9_9LECA|nr:hypothetical protein OEA41_006082 [Lepraria neglecta]
MASLAPLANLAPYHIMLYGTLLGTELYQSFVMTKVCYNALPMPAFTTLQKRVFPAYFRLQSLLFLLTAATHPPYGPVSLVSSAGDLAPMALGGALAVSNLVVYGPRTQEAMVERIHQETRDGKKYNDPESTEEMRVKNRAFSRAHAMSIHLNLVAIGATIWYGFLLASRMEFVVK